MKTVILITVLAIIGGLTGLEAWSRSFIERQYHGDPRIHFYPQLKKLRLKTRSPDTLSVGVFGSSITQTEAFSGLLSRAAARKYGKPARVYNLSEMGASIQDAYYLYRWMDRSIFDIVIVHHAIHSFKLNFSIESTDDDCSNISWYRRKTDVDRYYRSCYQTPFALAYLYTSCLEKKGRLFTDWSYWKRTRERSPEQGLRSNVALGSFRKYLGRFITLAESRHESPLILSHVFLQEPGRFAYRGEEEARLYGEFNSAMAEIAGHHGAVMIDLSGMAEDSGNFSDGMHFTLTGNSRCADIIENRLPREIPPSF